MLLNDKPARPGGHKLPGFAVRAAVAFAVASTLVAAAPQALPAPATEPPIYSMVYRTSAAVERISAAHNGLVADCMARLGFAYTVTQQTGTEDRPAPFGLESVDAPPETGFAEDPERATDAYMRALYGAPNDRVAAKGKRITVSRPANGCVADAERHLLGDGRVRWIQLRILLFEAEEDALKRLDQDHGFTELNSRWHQCMRQAGFDWPDPLRLLDDLPKDTDIRTHPATNADVRCKHETAYLTTAYARLSVMQQEVLDEDPSLVADWTTLFTRQDNAASASSPRKIP
ncbi:hypothetical protein ACIA8G_30505 [Lentzea sp. NPDC051213]|uniref:hypothetical protein n=1 Tax=Lentzea sp. NPDC051213 TaxID=3364126 RepID=UPI00379F3DA0